MSSKPKQAEHVISLDIGSTFTKAAVFCAAGDGLAVAAAAQVPTTPESLVEGVREVLAAMGCADAEGQPTYPVYFSSSAKGGLHVVAVGLVPELTLTVAKLTALSAGARVTRSYGYKLSEGDVREIEQVRPDIVLFSGGTDGGNETYVRHNAQRLAQLATRPQIIYAGNRAMREEVAGLLSDFPLHVTENILPELDRYCVDAARQTICEVFLKTIVTGKGLDAVVELLGDEPVPTPLAVMQLVEAIGQAEAEWSQFCLVDLGGATTDFYSCCANTHEPQVVYRGLAEPVIKRTVEGDLGIRCNAPSVLIAGSEALQANKTTGELLAMMDYINTITQRTGALPKNPKERGYDRSLAEICILQALRRHVGTRKRVFTAGSEVFVQTGKDLRGVRKMILTGGFLSRLRVADGFGEDWGDFQCANEPAGEMISLAPRDVTYYQDRDYLLPLLGNLVRLNRARAAQTAIEKLAVLSAKRPLSLEKTC